jgi:hypothetical protein
METKHRFADYFQNKLTMKNEKSPLSKCVHYIKIADLVQRCNNKIICILPKHIPKIATDNLYLFYSVCSLHVSAPTGHPQVKHNIICIFMKTIIPQHIRYFTIIHLYGVRLLLSIYLLYNHIMIIV